MSIHSSLTDPAEIHEAKQIAAADMTDAGKVITPSNSLPGQGVLRRLDLSELTDTTGILGDIDTDVGTTLAEAKRKLVTLYVADLDVAKAYLIPVDRQYTPVWIGVALGGSIASDSVIAVKDSLHDHGTVTLVAAGSVLGSMFESTLATPAPLPAAHRYIQVHVDGDAGSTMDAYITLLLEAP